MTVTASADSVGQAKQAAWGRRTHWQSQGHSMRDSDRTVPVHATLFSFCGLVLFCCILIYRAQAITGMMQLLSDSPAAALSDLP